MPGVVVTGASESPFKLGPHRDEILNAQGRWELAGRFSTGTRRLADCRAYLKERWRPALRSAALVDGLGSGVLCKLPRGDGRGFYYGKEFGVGHLVGDDEVRLNGALCKELGISKKDSLLTLAEFYMRVLSVLRQRQGVGEVMGTVKRGGRLLVQVQYQEHEMEVVIDADGRALIDPPRRRVAIEAATDYDGFDPPAGSAAFAWRKLGLVDPSGKPSRRGQVFARFHGGEGLMVAAALEDPTYPLDELVWHLANLRGGYRFAEDGDGGGSSRLGSCARTLYGMVDYPGYLELGLCPTYGESTAEVVEALLSGGKRSAELTTRELRVGDIERAVIEWLSLLRHVVHARELDWDRWAALQRICAEFLSRFAMDERNKIIEPLPPGILNKRIRQRFGFRDFQ